MYFLILILIFQISTEKKFIDSEGHSYGAYLSVPSSDSLKFLMGANTNNVDDNWDSQKISKLAVKAGLSTQRKEFSEETLTKKGYDSEIQNLNYAITLGQTDLIGFLTNPTKNHSSSTTDNKKFCLVISSPTKSSIEILATPVALLTNNFLG